MNNENSSQEEPPSWLDKIINLFHHDPKNRQELLAILNEASSQGIIDTEALSIIEGALQVAERQVRDIMVPRSKMICVEENQTPKEFLQDIITSAHSRSPVIGDTKDEVIGILLAKDLLPLIIEKKRFDIKNHIRPAIFIPESKRLNILLNEFRANRNHMAIVIDEFGGVAGLVTIEDVLEQIVGDIEDEHDVEEEGFIKPIENKDEKGFIIKALTPIEYFNDFFKSQLNDEEFDTIGGLIMQHFGRMPKRNESVTLSGFNFNVLHADGRRILLLKVLQV